MFIIYSSCFQWFLTSDNEQKVYFGYSTPLGRRRISIIKDYMPKKLETFFAPKMVFFPFNNCFEYVLLIGIYNVQCIIIPSVCYLQLSFVSPRYN